MLYILKRLLSFYYNKRVERADAKLEQFRLQQKTKVEELKTRTKYYQMKGLIEKFDPEIKVQKQAEYEREHINTGNNVKREKREVTTSISESNRTMTQDINSQNYHYPSKQQSSSWFDRVMDTIIGDDRTNKYALICRQCYAHNGLVRAEDYPEIIYKCSQCNFVNSNKRIINKESEMIIKEHPITCNGEQKKGQEQKQEKKEDDGMKLGQHQQQQDTMKSYELMKPEKREWSPSTSISSSSPRTKVPNATIETIIVETPSSSLSSSRKKRSSKK